MGSHSGMEIYPNLRDGGGQQSLLSTMNKFVHAVREMDETIMIPYRLKDIEPTQGSNGANGACVVSSNGSGASGAQGVNNGTGTNGNSDSALVHYGGQSQIADENLYACYRMLNAVKTELVRGHEGDETDGEDHSEGDESSRQVAAAFRHHLQGLFGLLRQLTDTAQYVTARYQEEVGETTSAVSPFAL